MSLFARKSFLAPLLASVFAGNAMAQSDAEFSWYGLGDPNNICIQSPNFSGDPLIKDKGDQMTAQMSRFPVGRYILSDIENSDTQICLNPVDSGSGRFYADLNAIVMSYGDNWTPVVDRDTADLISTNAHEWRHKWQTQDMGFATSSDYEPQHKALVGKFMEADAAAFAASALYDMESKGLDISKAYTENSFDHQVFTAYKEEADKDEKAIGDGRAMLAAFNAWFDTAVREDYENSYFTSSLKFAQTTHNEPGTYGDERVTASELLEIGAQLNGINYLSAHDVDVFDARYFGVHEQNKPVLREVRAHMAETLQLADTLQPN